LLWSPNTQLLYPFENQANDYSGNARHGTVKGSGVYATRPNGGRCLYFDGTGDYVATPSFGLSGTVLVFATWVRCKAQASISQVFLSDAAESGTVGFLRSDRKLNTNDTTWEYANGTARTIATASNFFASPYNDTWLPLCVVCDYYGKYTYFYRNGIPFGSPVAMTGTPVFPTTNRVKYIGSYNPSYHPLTDGYLQNLQLCTLATMPPVAELTANANRMMLGLHPIWSV
jgi:hypothetical protein